MISDQLILEFQKKFMAEVTKAKNIILTSHLSPDDDAIGSTLALYSYLAEKYSDKNVEIIFEGEVNVKRFFSLPKANKVKVVENISRALSNCDLLVIIDAHSIDRVTNYLDEFKANCPIVKIDHHRTSQVQFDLEISDPEATSAAELIYLIFFKDKDITADICKLLFFGIDGDTSGLSLINYNNSKVLAVVAALVEKGKINVEEFRAEYEKLSLEAFELLKTLYSNTTVVNNGEWKNFAYSYLKESDLKNFSFVDCKDATSRFVNFNIKKIEGVSWGFVLYPREKDTALSLRSTLGGPNVRILAEGLGNGGGHNLSAGAYFKDKNVSEAREIILNFLTKNKPEIVK